MRILHLEDSINDAELIARLLKKSGLGSDITQVDNQSAFESKLDLLCSYDVILADYSLPNYNGMQAFTFARDHCNTIPFIFVTGTMGEDVAIDTIKQGADDYILKGRIARLPTAILQAIKNVRLLLRK